MRNLLDSGRLLLLDMASTLCFLAAYLLTRDLFLSVGLAMALGVGQIGWQLARRKPIDTMQWLSLFLVLASGAATFLTNDARFVMVKPTLIYLIVGVVLLRPGWMNRYMPAIALAAVPDIVFVFGFIWAGLMFASAALNLVVAFATDAATWAVVMSIWGITSKFALFLIQYAVMRLIGAHRRPAASAHGTS